MRSLYFVPLLTGLLPIIAIHLTYLVSAAEGFVPWCFPYFESCTSISATGRHGTAYFLFKATMIPAAMLLMLHWSLSSLWLRSLGDSGRALPVILVLGVLGAVFLIVYTVALGAAGDSMRLQRRIGVVLYFTLTYLCQLLVVWRLRRITRPGAILNGMLGLSLCTLAIGMATLLLDVSIENYDDYEDAFEWILALLVHLHFLLACMLWRQTRFSAGFRSLDV
ncbi:MAG: hypothetical protein O3B72_07555 [Proteobacteria bacterium]|nr:hypothetical protein [Pseudomonadota bacterium]